MKLKFTFILILTISSQAFFAQNHVSSKIVLTEQQQKVALKKQKQIQKAQKAKEKEVKSLEKEQKKLIKLKIKFRKETMR